MANIARSVNDFIAVIYDPEMKRVYGMDTKACQAYLEEHGDMPPALPLPHFVTGKSQSGESVTFKFVKRGKPSGTQEED